MSTWMLEVQMTDQALVTFNVPGTESLEVVQAGRCVFSMLGFCLGTSASQGMQIFHELAQQQESCFLEGAALASFGFTSPMLTSLFRKVDTSL